MSLLARTAYRLLSRREILYVISHERSGTHLALNLLYRNLYIPQAFSDLPVWRESSDGGASAAEHWQGQAEKMHRFRAGGGLVKSHFDAGVFGKCMPPAPVVYVLRDPRDTLVSFYHFLNHPEFHANNPGLEELRCRDFAEFLRRPLNDFLRLGFTLDGVASNVMERWGLHVSGWLAVPGVIVVRYEQMLRDFRRTVLSVARGAKVWPKLRMSPVAFGSSGFILPRKGVAGDWTSHFSKDDLKLLADTLCARGIDLREWDRGVSPRPTAR